MASNQTNQRWGDAWLRRMASAWAGLICRRPWWVVVLCSLLAVLSVWVTIDRLQFNPNRNDLISKNLDWNKRFIAWKDSFPGSSDLVVVVDTLTNTPQAHAKARAMVNELGKKLAASDQVKQVVWGFDARKFSPRAARLLPLDQLQAKLNTATKAKPLLASAHLGQLIQATVANMREQQTADGSPAKELPSPAPTEASLAQTVQEIGELNRLLQAISTVLTTPIQEPVDFQSLATSPEDAAAGWQYLTSANGRLYFLLINPNRRMDQLSAFAPAIKDIRQLLAQVQPSYPSLEAGLTGIGVVEADETAAATWDSTWTSVLAAVLILALLIGAFHSFRVPVLAVFSLFLAIAWTFGFLTLAVGHLQVLSVVFTIILLGLGIAYAIHIAAAFELYRHDYPDTIEGFTQTLTLTLERVGPGLLTGSLTTAAAFGTTLFTKFTGVAEMGLIAGVGVLLCLVAMLTVFPALLRLVKPYHRHIVSMKRRKVHVFSERIVRPFVQYPWTTVAAVSVLTVLSLWAITRMHFDYDLLKLEPRGLASVQWQQRIVHDGHESIWFGVSVVRSLDEARALAQRYRQSPLVAPKLGGVGLLFPPQEEQRLAMLAQARKQLEPELTQALTPADHATVHDASHAGSELMAQLGILRRTLPIVMARQMPQTVRQSLMALFATLQTMSDRVGHLSETELQARLARLEQQYQQMRLTAAAQLDTLTDGQPLTLKDVPTALMHAYISRSGQLALQVYPDLSSYHDSTLSPLSPVFLPKFVKAMQSVDPNVTGPVVQIYQSGYLIKNAYQIAGLAAFLIVLVLVWLDFRSVYDSVLTLVLVAVGFSMTFGLMWVVGMQINPANIIVLPLMFGIGVDFGVHIVHRYHQAPTLRPLGLSSGTGKGVSLTSYTTMIGFGTMMLSSHRGMASLGFVLFSGIGLTMLACWTLLPAWLELRQRRVEKRELTSRASP